MVVCLEQGVDLYMAQLMLLPLIASCFSKIQIGFTFLVPAYLVSPGKGAIKRVCVCVQIPLGRPNQILSETRVSDKSVDFAWLGLARSSPCLCSGIWHAQSG